MVYQFKPGPNYATCNVFFVPMAILFPQDSNFILSYRTQLRVGLSKLNFHKFKHNFKDVINPMYPKSDGIEDMEHFLLLCPSFDDQRRDLLTEIVTLVRPFVQNNQSFK